MIIPQRISRSGSIHHSRLDSLNFKAFVMSQLKSIELYPNISQHEALTGSDASRGHTQGLGKCTATSGLSRPSLYTSSRSWVLGTESELGIT